MQKINKVTCEKLFDAYILLDISLFCVYFRFKMQSRFNLKPVLQSLGISDVFSPSAADFRGISGRIVKLKTVYTSHRC